MSSHLVERAVAEFLAVHPGRPVTVACSGGSDSLALALATLAVAGPEETQVVTVDHQLQAGSAERARSLTRLLTDRGVRSMRIETVSVGPAGGPEGAARAARYRALTIGAPALVLLGHTLDDQAETVLLGLSRGSGPRSIAGMPAFRAPFGRPLLRLRRTDTEAACRDHGVMWWTDPHNADRRFVRARLRHEVLPLLEDVLGAGVVPALARTADLLSEDLQALDLLAAHILAPRLDAQGSLDVHALADHPPALRRRVLRAWVSAGGIRELTADQLYRLDRLVTDSPRADVRLPGAVDAVRNGEVLTLRRLGSAGAGDA